MYLEDFQAAAVPADAAFVRMKQLGVPFTPHNYIVWYEYYSGRNPELRRVIDVMESNHQTITAERCREIHDRFFANGGNADRDIPSRLEAAANRILSVISGSGKDTAKYGQALQTFSGNLSGGVEADDLSSMIADILSETRTMHTHVRSLQSRVDESTREITDLREELELARRDAHTDGLTGIANRKRFDDKLRTAASHAMESGEPLSLIFADLDHFKKLNDTYGHQIGDHVLRAVAQILRQGIKGKDTAARYGGEEFAIILPNTHLTGATALAESLRKSVAGKRLVKKGSDQDFGGVTVSMGVTEFTPGESLEDFLRRSDMLLYRAKKYGRNRVVAEAAAVLDAAAQG